MQFVKAFCEKGFVVKSSSLNAKAAVNIHDRLISFHLRHQNLAPFGFILKKKLGERERERERERG